MFNMRGSVAYLAEDARIFFMKYIARFTYGVQAIEEIHETVSRQQLQIVKLMRWLVNIVF